MWLAGTLELASKVRYGMTSRGVPLFRFVPYDKRFAPLAVGCSSRSLHNVHAIVEPVEHVPIGIPVTQQMQKGVIVQNLGRPSPETELKVLLTTYAHDSRKELRNQPHLVDETIQFAQAREYLEGPTFHIDPPGCKDVDDSFTIRHVKDDIWDIAINIADVAAYVPEGENVDLSARARSTSFYTISGSPLAQMLPPHLEHHVSLLPDYAKLTVSLCFTYSTHTRKITGVPSWKLTETRTTVSYTYDEADLLNTPFLQILRQVAMALGAADDSDSHIWVEKMMIFYNQQAGKLLAENNVGILRKHTIGKGPSMQDENIPEFIFYESAEYCLPQNNTGHGALQSEFYAYASSPIRRYADLVNQRIIKEILTGATPTPQSQVLVDELNRRQKQSKAFTRDLFFSSVLANTDNTREEGIILVTTEEKTRVWVPAWKRLITVKGGHADAKKVLIEWYECRDQSRWKDRMVFKMTAI